MWRPRGGPSRLTWRRLMVLVNHLPSESATTTLARDSMTPAEIAELNKRPQRAGHGAWSSSDLLMARMSDQLDWVIYAIYAAQGGKPKEPKPLPRPGVMRPEDKPMDPKALAYLQRLRAQPRQ